jgi:4-hydroxymandelate oxidase
VTVDLDGFAEYADFEAYARERLDPAIYDHLAAGAHTNWTRDENRRAYDRWVFHKRLMCPVADPELATEIVAAKLDFPVMLAPSAFHKLVHPEGEVATARAAASMATTMVLSTLSSTPLEDVAATGVNCWLQLQFHEDDEINLELVSRAEQAGFSAIALTIDAPNYGIRPADKRAHLRLPEGVQLANFTDRPLPHHAKGEELMAYMWREMKKTCTWQDVRWLRERTELKIVAKGVLGAEDARHALDAGCDGIIVSNQGGRQLDGDPATLDVLPEVVAEVDGAVDVLVDGGIRNGTHVLKALALGAKATLIGRPQYWSLFAGGEDGVRKMLQLLRESIENSMQLAGVQRLDQLDRSFVRPAPGSGNVVVG